MTKHVYILGAGFSRPLGGPLFTDLITMEYWNCHSDVPIPTTLRNCLEEFHLATRDIDLELGTSRMNAEELISLLDWCSRNPTRTRSRIIYEVFERLSVGDEYPDIGVFLSALNRQLKRLVACQCNSFTKDLESESDTVAPYLSWLKRLQPQDTIITFNYDTAIETIASTYGVKFHREPHLFDDRLPKILHIHGCVDWVVDDGAIKYVEDAYLQDRDLCVAMPGLEKAKITDRGVMDILWNAASCDITAAEVISIVGYSMPASDNLARQLILDAMRPGQRVNLVVGSDSFTSGRMQSLMQPIVGTNDSGVSRVVDLKMYAQDYLPNVKHYLTYDYSVKTPR